MDFLSAGEYLIDLISTNYTDSFADATEYKRIPGGSPANLAMNLARLGRKVQLVATVGQDTNGHLLIDLAQRLGVDCSAIRRSMDPTTLVLVTRSREVSAFEVYRSADVDLREEQFSDTQLEASKVFHTTCFALSQQPAQSLLLNAAHRAAELNTTLSLDANYAEKIWPDRPGAQRVVREYIGLGAHLKMSEVDYARLFEREVREPKRVAHELLEMGAHCVVLTLGGEGCYYLDATTEGHLPARPVAVKDTTGAGDAFWSGYWHGWLDGKDLPGRCETGRAVAELKLGHFGPLPDRVELSQ